MPTGQGWQIRIAFRPAGNWHRLKVRRFDQQDDQVKSLRQSLPEVVGGIHVGKRINVTNPVKRKLSPKRFPGVLKRVRC